MDPQPESSTSKGKGKEPAQEPPTTPPRISFGVELEFLVAERPGKTDPDQELAHLLPPVYRRGKTLKRMQELLESKGIPMITDSSPKGWEIDEDISVYERGTRGQRDYDWKDVELISPASYAIDEAFDMIRLVVYLVTKNFRCRVNESTGFHVHIGNGFDRIPFHAMRSFSSIWWAAEPLLTMLHPPERALKSFSLSGRRLRKTFLARNKTAESARSVFMEKRPEIQSSSRYYGRDRKLGETPEPVYLSSKTFQQQEKSNVRLEDDNVDWAAPLSEPHRRPIIPDFVHEPFKDQDVINPSRLTLKRGPPEIPTTTYDESCQSHIFDFQEEAGDILPRPRQPPFPRKGPRNDNHRPLEMLIDGIPGRLQNFGLDYINRYLRPLRKDGWSAIRELQSCDAHSNQLASLMTDEHQYREFNFNMSAYCPITTKRSLELPDNYLSEAGQKERDRASARPGVASKHDLYQPPRVTIECREATGSLDGDWIVTWARIVCRLLEWSRDAAPSELLRVIGLCIEATEGRREYDAVDLLDDVGLWAEARFCEDRMQRVDEAWFQCMLLKEPEHEHEALERGTRLLAADENQAQMRRAPDAQQWMSAEANELLKRATASSNPEQPPPAAAAAADQDHEPRVSAEEFPMRVNPVSVFGQAPDEDSKDPSFETARSEVPAEPEASGHSSPMHGVDTSGFHWAHGEDELNPLGVDWSGFDWAHDEGEPESSED